MVVERHGHASDHFVFVVAGEITVGDRICGPGTHITLEEGAVFGPIIAGPEGANLYEIMQGDPRAIPTDHEGFARLLAERGITPLPNPPVPWPAWLASPNRRRSRHVGRLIDCSNTLTMPLVTGEAALTVRWTSRPFRTRMPEHRETTVRTGEHAPHGSGPAPRRRTPHRGGLRWIRSRPRHCVGWFKTTPNLFGIGADYVRSVTGLSVAAPFDLLHPPILLYDGEGPDAKFAGVSYVVKGNVPGFSGCYDVWHSHKSVCIDPQHRITLTEPRSFRWYSESECRAAGGHVMPLAADKMIHVWIGPGYTHAPIFAHDNPKLFHGYYPKHV